MLENFKAKIPFFILMNNIELLAMPACYVLMQMESKGKSCIRRFSMVLRNKQVYEYMLKE